MTDASAGTTSAATTAAEARACSCMRQGDVGLVGIAHPVPSWAGSSPTRLRLRESAAQGGVVVAIADA
jgi:hypothetical protein